MAGGREALGPVSVGVRRRDERALVGRGRAPESTPNRRRSHARIAEAMPQVDAAAIEADEPDSSDEIEADEPEIAEAHRRSESPALRGDDPARGPGPADDRLARPRSRGGLRRAEPAARSPLGAVERARSASSSRSCRGGPRASCRGRATARGRVGAAGRAGAAAIAAASSTVRGSSRRAPGRSGPASRRSWLRRSRAAGLSGGALVLIVIARSSRAPRCSRGCGARSRTAEQVGERRGCRRRRERGVTSAPPELDAGGDRPTPAAPARCGRRSPPIAAARRGGRCGRTRPDAARRRGRRRCGDRRRRSTPTPAPTRQTITLQQAKDLLDKAQAALEDGDSATRRSSYADTSLKLRKTARDVPDARAGAAAARPRSTTRSPRSIEATTLAPDYAPA